jgi:hypothetical protein
MTSKLAVFQVLLLLISTTLVRATAVGASTLSTSMIALTPALPTLTCYTADAGLDKAPVGTHIKDYCGNKTVWDLRLIPAIRSGNGNLTDVTLTESYAVSYGIFGSTDVLWLGVKFSNETCSGYSSFIIGNTEDEKYTYCARRFESILDTCSKKGGLMKDVCINYSIIRSTSNANPYQDTKDLGDFPCKKTTIVVIPITRA